MTDTKKLRIGDLLVQAGLLKPFQLNQALDEQKKTGHRLGRVLTEMGLVEENQLLGLLSRQLNIPFIDLTEHNFKPEVVRRLPETMARRFRAIVLQDRGDELLVGMVDPMDIFAVDELSRVLKQNIQQAVVRESELLNVLDVVYRRTEEIANIATELEEELSEETQDIHNISELTAEGEDAPVVRLLRSIFEDAIQINASDIHIEPDERELRIRNRVDGILHEQVMKETRVAAALVLRLKLMSGLNISERRLPQDGRFNIKVRNKNIDVRLSTMPLQHGEAVVMRLLDHSNQMTNLDNTGMPLPMLSRFRGLLQRPHGLILVTGPTGSGKTTTLYGGLQELNTAQKKIITAEDPVEYRLPRINQVQVNTRIGLTFATVLRVALRQDPDVLLIGEIRDGESAEIALRAAMTGHLVLSTLHTNDAISSTVRLMDMGVEPYLVASSLRAVLAQRLIRKNCPYCLQTYVPEPAELEWFAASGKQTVIENIQFKQGTGCSRCSDTGFRGRVGVFELLEIHGKMASAIRLGDNERFARIARADPGFRRLSDCALDYVSQGVTTIGEVARVAEQIDETELDLPSAPAQLGAG